MSPLRKLRPLLLAAAAAGAVFLLAKAPERTPTSGRTATCALSNPGYSGWCRVTESIPKNSSAAAVCQNVIRCLNDLRCAKTYCNATTIRGGWKLEAVNAEWKKK